MNTLAAGIIIDSWKLSIFERHLQQAGFSFENLGEFTPDTIALRVHTDAPDALHEALKAANTEAARTRGLVATSATVPVQTVVLTDGSAVTPDHREIDPATGQQRGYVVLSAEERAKGFVRPLRLSYVHRKCGVVTRMAQSIAETYARDPSFYSGTFCVGCRTHRPLHEFRWDGTDEQVGS